MASVSSIWRKFLTISKSDPYNIPNNEKVILETIKNSIDFYNIEAEGYEFKLIDIKSEDVLFQDGEDIGANYITLLAYFLRRDFLENQISYNSSLYKPFTKEIGQSSLMYRTDMDKLEVLLKRTEDRINQIIFNMSDSLI